MALSGQIRQSGFLGVQIVAPRSISACARSPARTPFGNASANPCARFAIKTFAARQPASVRSDGMAHSRETTRSILPSTGAMRSSNAIEAMAAAVYGPTPASSRRLFASCGKLPHAATAFAQACRLRARL
jgi:hypothetical protein